MPVWGPLFSALGSPSTMKPAEVQLRINNLSKYIETLQVK
jgi:hypothetical protein